MFRSRSVVTSMTSPDGGEVQGTLALFCGARRNGACLAARFRRDCDGPAGAAEPADGPVRPAAPPAAAVPLLCPCAGVGLLRIWAARRAGRRIASVDRPHSRRAECGIVFDPEAGAMFPKICPSPFSANAPWPMISSQVGFLTRRSGGNLPVARRAAAGTLPQASPPPVGRAAANTGTGWSAVSAVLRRARASVVRNLCPTFVGEPDCIFYMGLLPAWRGLV